ncbi:hypothetical protein MKW98_008377 [Papaver atlanticum]|uniref:Uncharacterized protein n=1 Tax=Papaver atlanticum TaxID=357466 RepID=A0AAD4SE55_9MAGN|nr:hypothetical protein MKW98_008377 [Papaver atlanticum]
MFNPIICREVLQNSMGSTKNYDISLPKRANIAILSLILDYFYFYQIPGRSNKVLPIFYKHFKLDAFICLFVFIIVASLDENNELVFQVLDLRSLTLSRLKLQIHQVSDQLVDNNTQDALPVIAGYSLGSRLLLIGGHSKELSDVITGSSVSLYLPHLHTIRLVHCRKFVWFDLTGCEALMNFICEVFSDEGGFPVLKILALWPSRLVFGLLTLSWILLFVVNEGIDGEVLLIPSPVS